MYVDIRNFGDRYSHVTPKVLSEWSRTKWYNSLRKWSLPRQCWPFDIIGPDGASYRVEFFFIRAEQSRILVRIELTLWDLID